MRFIAIILIFSIAAICHGASPYGNTPEQQNGLDNSYNLGLPVFCDSYDSCIDLGLKERKIGLDSVLIFLSEGFKDNKYGIYDNVNIKLSGNTCPPILNVYKTVNNINYFMDTFKGGTVSSCIKYYSNITGDSRHRDVVVEQLEVTYCNSDIMFENCNQGIVYVRKNTFVKNKAEKPNQKNTNVFPDSTDSTMPYQYGNQYQMENDINLQNTDTRKSNGVNY